jgi:hypothetical protein
MSANQIGLIQTRDYRFVTAPALSSDERNVTACLGLLLHDTNGSSCSLRETDRHSVCCTDRHTCNKRIVTLALLETRRVTNHSWTIHLDVGVGERSESPRCPRDWSYGSVRWLEPWHCT